jgi:hypothetical protein
MRRVSKPLFSLLVLSTALSAPSLVSCKNNGEKTKSEQTEDKSSTKQSEPPPLVRRQVNQLIDEVVMRNHYFRDTPFSEAIVEIQQHLDTYCDKNHIEKVKLVAPESQRKMSFGGSAQTIRMKINSLARKARLDVVFDEENREIRFYDPKKFPDGSTQ